MAYRRSFAVTLITTTIVMIATATSAQEAQQMRLTGTLTDYVWVDVGAGAGAWQVSGTWSVKVHGDSGKGEFVAAILGVRSDLWVVQTGSDPQTTSRSPHTHHVALLDAPVTAIPGGIRLTGNAIMTTNGNVAPQFSGSPIVVDITGGETVHFSNMKLTFLGASTEHFGSHAYDGVVTLER
jgi:hypothetical protein